MNVARLWAALAAVTSGLVVFTSLLWEIACRIRRRP